MAVTYVGAGSYASANNASITPGLPAGLQEGDALCAFVSIYEDAATIDTPAGWTSAGDGTSTIIPKKTKVVWRYYTAGVTAPTFTFSGGGANDTTQGIVLAFRGVDATLPIARAVTQWSNPTHVTNAEVRDTSYAPGDYLLAWRVVGNDEVPDTGGWMTQTGQPDPPSTALSFETTQGRDASLNMVFGEAVVAYVPDTNVHALVPPRLNSGSQGFFDAFIIYQGVTNNVYSHSGSGGAKAGGAAVASLRQSVFTYSGSGGAVAGGSAPASIRYPTFPYTGSGGLVGGGAAPSSYRQTVRAEAGSGGAVIGGAAVATLLAPTNYHIDPFNGSDTNDGLSWVSALRTFRPLADGTLALGAGDRVKIAKTPAAVAHGSFTSQPLAGLLKTTINTGWSTGGGYSLGSWTVGKIKVIDQLDSTTGWTIPSGAFYAHTTEVLQPFNLPAYSPTIQGSFVQDRLVAYKALAATVDLAAFTRLELRIAPQTSTGSAGLPFEIAVSLCSDAAGATELLRMDITNTNVEGGVVAYNGPLPDGVNSIAIRTITDGEMSSTKFTMYSLLACMDYSSADYIGHYSQFRFGNHEASYWMAAMGYYESGGTTYVMLSKRIVGPASLHNTSMTLYSRTAVAWNRTYKKTSMVHPLVSRQTARQAITNEAVLPTFNLLDLKSISSDPITITGGYDTGTNTVTGKTAITHRLMEGNYTSFNHAPPFFFAGTEYVTFKNIDVFCSQSAIWAIENDSKGMRFENCELMPIIPIWTTLYGEQSTVTHAAGTTPTMTDTYFKDCTGWPYPFTHNASEPTADRQNSVAQYNNTTLDNCLIHAWCGVPLGLDNNLGFNTLATMIGDLKVYCVGNYSKLENAYTDTYNYQLPAVKSGAAGTMRVWAGGACLVAPVANADGAFTGVYFFPKMVLENTFPAFSTRRLLNNRDGGYARGGDVEYMEVPEITITTTDGQFHTKMDASPTSSNFNITHLLGTDLPHAPPLHVKKLTMSGPWWSGYTVAGAKRCAVCYTAGGAIQVSDIDVTGAGADFDFQLIGLAAAFATNNPGGVFGEALGIIDVFADASRSYSSTLYLIGYLTTGNVVGNFDLRSVTIDNTNASAHVYSSVFNNYGCLVRLRNCNITNPAEEPYKLPDADHNFGSTNHYAMGGGFESGLIHEASTIAAGTHTTGMVPSASTDIEAGATSGVVNLKTPLTVVDDNNNIHAVYYYPSLSIEKDFTIYPQGDHSWKVTSMYRLVSPLSCNIPLASVPVLTGKTVTVTLQTRRGHADAYAALVVHHNGCGGNAAAADFVEHIAVNSGTVGAWVTLQVQFTCVRSGTIDIAVAHFGKEGENTWFTDFRVIES